MPTSWAYWRAPTGGFSKRGTTACLGVDCLNPSARGSASTESAATELALLGRGGAAMYWHSPVEASGPKTEDGADWQQEPGDIDGGGRGHQYPKQLGAPTLNEARCWHSDHGYDGDDPDQASDGIPNRVCNPSPRDHDSS